MKDPRERRFVSKFDRYELEDKYLRLLDEVQSLKKLSNTQEDKIKKLATKLMRVSASPRSCVNFKDIFNDKDKISILESENDKVDYILFICLKFYCDLYKNYFKFEIFF